jgi:RND superfamily putative drug exporter
MLLVPDTVLRSLAFGAIAVGVVAVAAALTLLPAMLALLGDRIERGRIPFVPQQYGAESRFWRRTVSLVTARPGITAGVTGLLLLLLALPVLGLQTGSSGISALPENTVGYRGFQALEESFPAGARTDPAEVVVDADPSSATVTAAIGRLESTLADDPAFGSTAVTANASGDLGVIEIGLTGDASAAHCRAARRGAGPAHPEPLRQRWTGTGSDPLEPAGHAALFGRRRGACDDAHAR